MRKLPQSQIKVRTLLIALLLLGFVMAVAVVLTRGFWSQQLRAWARGSIDVAADKYVTFLPKVDRVEIYLLGDQMMTPNAKAIKSFSVWNFSCPVLSQKNLTGAEASDFRLKWRNLTCAWGWSGLCHEPAYGFRFYGQRKLLLETSFCWKCSNFIVPTPMGYGFCGFDEKSTNAQSFWKLVQHHIPLPAAASNPPPARLRL